ncbi:MAG: DNA recombination protein RmuC, partial [Acidimicrobiales bacterium]
MTFLAISLALVALVAVIAVAVMAARLATVQRHTAAPGDAEPDRATVDAVNDAVRSVVGDATERIDQQLGHSRREMELRAQAMDRQMEQAAQQLSETQQAVQDRLGSVETSIEKKVAAVDQIVAERVGGVREVVDAGMTGVGKELGTQMSAMDAELKRVHRELTQVQEKSAAQHSQFVEGMQAAVEGQRVLTDTTAELRQALANPKARGQWGERMADDVLRSAGFREHVNYRKQSQLPGGTTPDFTFLLPDDQQLHMDVKFPVDNYLRYLESDRDDDQQRLAQQFKRDVRSRVKELTTRGYADPTNTLGFVLLFIPNEAVYSFIHEQDPGFVDFAMGEGVAVCSPNTLFAVLAVVRRQVDAVAVQRASSEILERLGKFSEQWQKMSEHIDKVDRQLATVTKSMGELSGT